MTLVPTIEWRSFPYREMSGDAFGHKCLNDKRFSFYVIDVAGHGEEASAYVNKLVAHLHKLQESKDPRLLQPEELLSFFNREYPMSANNNLFFSMWYGVYNLDERCITYASAGAPPAVITPKLELLSTQGVAIGMIPDAVYKANSVQIGDNSTLYLFTDGVYELLKQDGRIGTLAEFLAVLKKTEDLDALVEQARAVSQNGSFRDDFCLVKIQFDPK